MSASTSRQNSSSVCQSRPLRASRDASIHKHRTDAAIAQHGQEPIEARTMHPTAGATQIIIDDRDLLPPERARTINQGVLTTLGLEIVLTCSRVDWRTYTMACRFRCSVVNLLIGLIPVFSARGVE